MSLDLFKCKVCEKYKTENEYLKALVDKLLAKSGIEPIKKEKEELKVLDEVDKILANGGEVFGEG